jgi:hypothetical protein
LTRQRLQQLVAAITHDDDADDASPDTTST